MADNTNGAANGQALPEQNQAQLSLQRIYVKDVSFEVPGAPGVFNEQTQPQLQMNLQQAVQRLNENAYEVVLGINLTCAIGDKAVYVAEVKQAGVFGLAGFDAATLDGMLGVHCPTVLYPYARQLISDLIQAGGFPPFFLQPINFEALYAEGLRRRAESSQGSVAMSEGGNA